MVPNLDSLIQNIFEKYYLIKQTSVKSIINIEISNCFLDKIKEINSIFGQLQIENIMNTLTYIQDKNKNEKQELYKKSYLNKCVKWCKKYNVPIHDIYNC
jgi:predicted Ser/Thr protein kinase